MEGLCGRVTELHSLEESLAEEGSTGLGEWASDCLRIVPATTVPVSTVPASTVPRASDRFSPAPPSPPPPSSTVHRPSSPPPSPPPPSSTVPASTNAAFTVPCRHQRWSLAGPSPVLDCLPAEKHEPRGVGRSSASVYMSKQVVAVTNGSLTTLVMGMTKASPELGGWDEVVAVTGGSGYKWERLWYCSLITLIMGMIKARPGIVGGLILVAARGADSLVTVAHIKGVVFNVGLIGFVTAELVGL
ncbi:hypothetical protein Syun_016308 [Stephania yunnanensis]|uniref:Uncharacterized protein n=1 Tax=Stephania yunnanensis TaxID=152371 RepID=A0AAP0P4R9_9MAGN